MERRDWSIRITEHEKLEGNIPCKHDAGAGESNKDNTLTSSLASSMKKSGGHTYSHFENRAPDHRLFVYISSCLYV